MRELSGTQWALGVGLFLGCWLSHFLIWRFFQEKRSYPLLFIVFLGGSALGLFHSEAVFWVSSFLSVNYLVVFPAIQASSPTLVLLETLRTTAVKEKDWKLAHRRKVVEDRLSDLVSGGLVKLENGKLSLAPMGRGLAFIFKWYRWTLGLPLRDGG